MTFRILPAGFTPEVLGALCHKVSRVQPFAKYPFGLMVAALSDQLRHRTNLVVHDDRRIVAYVGWIHARSEVAEAWMRGEGPLAPDWKTGDATVMTVLVADKREYIAQMIRAAAPLNEGRPVYRKRSFADGRPERKSRPITSRRRATQDPSEP